VTAVSPSTAWIAGWNGFVARTINSGQTWRAETIPGADNLDFEDALFVDANTGWVGGNIGIWQRHRRHAPVPWLSVAKAKPRDFGITLTRTKIDNALDY
jgi:hypothetical protein